MTRARCIVAGLLAALLVLALPALAAAKLPAYRTPGYRGTTKVPRLRAQATPPARPVELSALGRYPDTFVDAAGTAHIVWSEDEGDGADVVRYCRLRRAAGGCDVSQRLVWEKAYDVGDDPRFNVDQDGPRVVVIGDQLVVLSFRYPTIAEKPDRSDPDSTVLAWVSDDGGASFSGPAIVGNGQINGGAVAFGPADDPTILTMNDTVTLCHSCVQAIRPGTFTSASGSLSTGADQAYSGSLALENGLPVAAFADLGRTTFVRRWTGAGSVIDPATWTPPFSVPGDEPTLAGGPAGAFLVNRPQFGGPLVVRKLAGASAGRAVTISGREDAVLPDLFEDPSGRVLAAWVARFGTPRLGTMLRSSTDGRTWAPAQRLLDGGNAGQLAIGAASDGGGVVALNRTGGINSLGPIAAVPIGPRTQTGFAGLGNLPGGGDASARSTCQQITFGVVRIASPTGCFLKGTGRFASVNVTNGEVDFNGLKIVPDAGVRIMIDARNHTLDTTGPVRALLRGAGEDIVLWHGPLHVELPTAAEGVPFSFPTGQFSAELKGFDVVGRIDVFLTRGGVRIPISLKLPPYLGGVTGQAVLLADSTRGLHLDSLVIDVAQAPVGPLVIKDLHIEYSGGEDRWAGGARLELPPQPGGAKIAARVVFVRGAFESGEVVVTPPFPPGVPLGPGVWLSEIGGGVRLSPLALSLSGQVGALPLTPRGPFTVTVDGRATVDFGNPLTFTFDGGGNLVDVRLSSVHMLANVNGFANASAAVEFDLDVVSGQGRAEMTVDGPGRQFLAELLVNLEIADQDFVEQRALASNIGFGGCYELLVASLGFGYRWSTRTPEIMFPSCDLSAYKPVPGGGGQPGGPLGAGSSFTVRAGTPSVSVQVDGDGGLPQVVLVAPNGERITPLLLLPPLPTDPLIVQAIRAMALPVSPTTITIGIVRPAAGTWRIEPAAGAARTAGGGPRARAAAVTGMRLATGLEPPAVSARLRGAGRTRTLAYRGTRRAGLTVTFVERFRGGTRALGRARRAGNGTLRFATGDLPGGRRTVIALLAQDGVPRVRRTVASYVAPPPPRPARVRGVRIGRAGGGIVVRWARADGAAAYLVRVTTGDGRRLARIVGPRTRSLRVARVARRYGATAVVAGRTRTARSGPPGRARLAAQAQPRRSARAPRRR